ncbi:MAG: AmpG family muropeptide MFS transporter [Bacteroides sp.]|nr:AmpG family muropeptide MFS transporter [Bacteroides sp.]
MLANGLKTSRRNPWFWIPSLYLAEGFPNAVVVTVAVVLLKNLGMDNGRVAFFTSLLYLPWVIKPFWAPFVDMFSTKRKWIVLMQMAIFIGLGAVSGALHTPFWLSITLGALWWAALSSATHDIAADGFYMLALNEQQQAFYVGIRSTFYRAANMLASGGVVWLAGRLISGGNDPSAVWSLMFAGMALLFLIFALWHWMILPVPEADVANKANGAREILGDFVNTFVTFFRKPGIGVAMAFMLLYRLPEAILGKMVQPFLLDKTIDGGLQLTTEHVGLANGTFGVAGIVLGGIVGGIVMSRFGLRKCLWPMALMLTLPSGFYCYLAFALPSDMTLICSGIALEQFGYGFGFTAYMMYMMMFCEGSEYTTSHYAFCTGLMALGLMLPAMASGWIQQAIGYQDFFSLVMILCVVTFIVTAIAYKNMKR